MATITEYLKILLEGRDLDQSQATALQDTIFAGEVPEAQIAAFLTAMAAKGQTPTEVAGLAASLRSHAVPVSVTVTPLVDTCGTGGGKFKTCNVSTAAALVVAGAGIHVAKHGNRGITSGCGSADVLEALGVKIDAVPEVIARCITEAGVGFMFAPKFHPATRHVQPIRKALGFRTVFNILGPLSNPAHVQAQVLGVADEKLMPTMIDALRQLGIQRAMVVHSDGLDEVSTFGPTQIADLQNGQVQMTTFEPKRLGIAPPALADLQVTDAQDSAASLKRVLRGEQQGPKRDIIALNAAASIQVGGGADSWEEGWAAAQESIDSGKALAALQAMVKVSNS